MTSSSLLVQCYLDEAAEAAPSKTAVWDGTLELSWRELAESSNRLAHCLREIGVRPGDRVALSMKRSGLAIVAAYGILKADAAYIPVDPKAPPGCNMSFPGRSKLGR